MVGHIWFVSLLMSDAYALLSGKSTQVPTFILEDQLSRGKQCKIYCTEPRRISAISLAQRVSRELGDPPGAVGTLSSLVGYSIRLESNTSRNTKLAFVTNGKFCRQYFADLFSDTSAPPPRHRATDVGRRNRSRRTRYRL